MIKLLQLNCRGYYVNRHMIAEVLTAEDPDVVLLNHTGTLPPTRTIKHYGYSTCISHTRTPNDGVAILVKHTILHDFLTTWTHTHFLGVRIRTLSGPILIATTYARPDTGLPYTDITTLFNYTNMPVYLVADLNAKHTDFHHPTCNLHGTLLKRIIDRKRLRLLGPDFPTFFGGAGTGRPDLALANNQSLRLHHHLSPGPLCGSDHIPLLLRLSTNPISVPSPPHYQYHRADWDAFRDALTTTHTPPRLEDRHHTAIDTTIDTLHATILRAANSHIPMANHRIYRDFRPSIRTQRLMTCYQTRHTFHRHHHPHLLRDLPALRRHIINSLQEDHDRHWQDIIHETQRLRNTDPSQFWRRIHNLRGCNTTPFRHLTVDNTRITDPDRVADAFKDYWSLVFQPHPPPPHAPTTTHIDDITDIMRRTHADTQPLDTVHTDTLQADNILTAPIEEADVRRLLKRAPRRAPGPTGLTWAMARNLPPCIISDITAVFNASLATGYFPRPFKTAITILIPKPNKSPHHPANYRPISLLEVIGKTFERLLNSRLRQHMDFHDLLSPKHYGFRQHSSTEDALTTITTYLKLNSHFKCALVTKDVKQAFDTVWHDGLKYKICHDFALPPTTQRLLCNFLTDRQMTIRHKRSLSTSFSPLAGVPQGSVLSPTLFNMYTNDLPDPLHPDSLTIQYADDVTQLTRARHLDHLTDRLQGELTATSLWELKWRIRSHPDKAAVTYFNIKRDVPRQIYLYPFLPDPRAVRRSQTNKVLGLTFDERLCFRSHVTNKVAIASRTLSSLQRFRGSSARTKLHLYKALVLPLLTYCPLALTTVAPTNHLLLQVVQNKALRFVLDSRWYDFTTARSLHDTAKIPPLNVLLHTRLIRHIEHYTLHHNDTHTFLHNLPPFRRDWRPHNLLHPPDPTSPEPIYTRQ